MATCKECVHNNVCNIKQKYNHPKYALQHIEKYCEHLKDHSRFVGLPCKVGDTFFVIIESSDILEYKVFYINMFCGEVYDEIEIVLDRNYHRIEYTKERFEYELGKTLFSTKKEAEQALKECESNGGL